MPQSDAIEGECPDVETARQAREAGLPEDTCRRILKHLDSCPRCGPGNAPAAVAPASTSRPTTEDADATPALVAGHANLEATELKAGTVIGRYIILGRLGEGGMATVYGAYDNELQRRVALKFLQLGAGGGRSVGRARMLREAQTMAQLSHPNVVAVYDVGTYQDQVFIAMELVDDGNLKDWLQKPRRPQEIIDAYMAAGRGLHAAHQARLIHRDFKPANVLVGKDGRMRVTDFGLARGRGEDEEDEKSDPKGALPAAKSSDDTTGRRRLIDTTLTQAGSSAGTPAYMAPEQKAGGGRVDARCDQYSFCVALCESLTGERPAQPRHRRVPGWVQRVLIRGLSPAPDERFPSMGELLDALAHNPAVLRQRVAVGAAIVACLATATGWVVHTSRQQGSMCKGSEALLAGVWDGAVRLRVEKAFQATGASYAGDALAHVGAILDRYAHDFVAMRTDACAATRLRGDQSEAVMSLRMLCLDQARAQLGALTDVLATGDAGVVRRASQAASGLPRIADCADIAALTRDRTEPRTPAERHALERGTAELAHATALFMTGQYKQALGAAEALEKRLAGSLPRLGVEVMFLRAKVLLHSGRLVEAEAALEQVVAAAMRSGYQLYVARSLSALVWLASARGDGAQANRYALFAEATTQGIGGDPFSDRFRLNAMASVQEDNDQAVSMQKAALAAYKNAGEDLYTVNTLGNLGTYLARSGQLSEALEVLNQAIAVAHRVLGPNHPEGVIQLGHRSIALIVLGRYQEAMADAEHLIAAREHEVAAQDLFVADACMNEGKIYAYNHQCAKAIERVTRAYATYPAEVRDSQGGSAEMGEVFLMCGRAKQAISAILPAMKTFEASGGVVLQEALAALGEAYVKDGQVALGVKTLERGLELASKEHNVVSATEIAFRLGQALGLDPAQRTRARGLVASALAGFAKFPNPARAQEAQQWLETHPSP